MTNNVIIRGIRPSEFPLMEEIMYEAIYHPDPANPYPKEVIYYPQVRVYWDNWGKGKEEGFSQASLSITKGNPAIRLYERLGFQVINENEEDFIMLLVLE